MQYTRFEKARIIGARSLQISMGAPFMIKLSQEDLEKLRYSPLEIAKLEFEKEVIPITVRRPFPKSEDYIKEIKNKSEVKKMDELDYSKLDDEEDTDTETD